MVPLSLSLSLSLFLLLLPRKGLGDALCQGKGGWVVVSLSLSPSTIKVGVAG